MTDKTASEIMTKLDDILDRERAALLAGDLDQVPGLLEEKTALIEALDDLGPDDRQDMGALRDKAARNQALLDGALQGIRQVAGRLAAFRRLRHSFDTYDETGHKRTIEGDVVHKVEKRA